MDLTKAQDILRRFYGFSEFRPGQQKIIASLLDARDTLAVMPTGAGKSLCFQIPALLLPGVTIVVSPLISLMKDQVDALAAQGIPATFLNSSLSAAENSRRFYDIGQKRYKLVYVAPERLALDRFQRLFDDLEISLVAVDEAHCLSQWGHDFRPSYQAIFPFIRSLPQRPRIGAFTATATPEVKDDIVRLLGLQRPAVHVTGFDRPNLFFQVLRGENKQRFILDYLAQHADQSGIIYAATRKDTDALCELLARRGFKAGRYHAGLSDEERAEQQERFLYDDTQVIVATNAFGMGIDKSNVRYVIHYNMPKNMEAYYQEAGRSGRDGERGECILLFGAQDVMLQKFLIDKSVEAPERKQNELNKLQSMVDYCHTPECLRAYILRYFGEAGAPESCGNCSNCNDEGEVVDITVDAQKVFSCVLRLRERFGLTMVADVLKGSKNQKVLQYGFDRLPTYGLFAERTAADIKALVQRLVATQYLCLSESEFPVVQLAPAAYPVLKGEACVRQKVAKIQKAAPDDALFQALRALRKEIADAAQIPPYHVFSDATLRDMCRLLPATPAAFARVKGVGEVKIERYGKAFLEAIAAHAPAGAQAAAADEMDATPPAKIKEVKTPTHLVSAQQFQSGSSIAEIAAARSLTEKTVQSHLVKAAAEGVAIDWNRVIPPQYEALIVDAVKRLGAQRLRPLKDALPPEVEYAAIHAVIAKHFS